MRKLTIIHKDTLYRNPDPGHRAICAMSPNVVALSERELLCFYRKGQALYSLDGTIGKLRSCDGGITWLEENPVWNPTAENDPYTYAAPHASQLRDGTLLLIAQRLSSSLDEYPFRFNPQTGGLKPTEIVLFRSDNNGRSWTRPEVIPIEPKAIVDAPSSLIELNEGRWFLGCEQWKDWNDSSPLHIKGFALFSDDQGHTWGNRLPFPSASHVDRMYSHTRYSRMLDGRICALQWTQSVGARENFDLHFVCSDETATKWPEPQPTNLPGQNSWVADLGAGTLVACYAVREREGLTPGVRAVLSEDCATTWDLKNEIMLWDASGREWMGVTHKKTYPSSHDNIAFGKVHALRLPDGQVMCSWWCTEACVIHMQCARIAVE